MFVNWQLRELNLKIVYYGPALSGKTTNLEQIYARVDPRRRSELVLLKTHEDRTLYFDFLQLELGKIAGLIPRVQLYTVPGQVYYEASRRIVLRGVDGIVFVADSSADRLKENIESLENLKYNLAALQIPMSTLPVVIQYNKRDLPSAMPLRYLKDALQLDDQPAYEAIAIQGIGVFETLKAIVGSVLNAMQSQLRQGNSHDRTP
jgi:signal recognition particle receptor subunit beta